MYAEELITVKQAGSDGRVEADYGLVWSVYEKKGMKTPHFFFINLV